MTRAPSKSSLTKRPTVASEPEIPEVQPRGARNHVVMSRTLAVVDGVVRRVLGASDPEHEDLVQSALERVLATIETGKFREDCPLHLWAAKIARNVAMDALRARSRDRRVFARDISSELLSLKPAEGGPEHLAEVHRHIQEIKGALHELGGARGKPFYLHDVLGHDLEEVAAIMGTSVAAAQSRLVRGRHIIEQTQAAEFYKKGHLRHTR